MRKKILPILILVAILAAMVFFVALNSILKKIPDNSKDTIGNTAGNLNNSGLFCESDSVVYFSNPYDGGAIYSMSPDETDFKKINNSNSSLICAAGDYLYYYMDTSGNGGKGLGNAVRNFGVYRMKKNGKYATSLDRQACTMIQVVGDYVYYEGYNNTDYSKTYKIKTDKTGGGKISDTIINPAAAYNGTIYFNGTEKDHYLYALNTETDQVYTVYQGNLWYPQYAGGYIYYMDVSSNYRLCRYELSSGNVDVLTEDRVDTFNVGSSYIYYQKNDSDAPALMRMRIDGSSPEIVKSGNHTSINLTSEYCYFKEFGSDSIIYHTPVNGSINVTTFDGALNAAIEAE